MTPDEIRQLRESIGLTQDDFGRLLDVSQKQISRWENGEYKPNRFYKALLELVRKNHEQGIYTDSVITRFQIMPSRPEKVKT
jgi:DNA-binding transcriptional regulator YiaG